MTREDRTKGFFVGVPRVALRPLVGGLRFTRGYIPPLLRGGFGE